LVREGYTPVILRDDLAARLKAQIEQRYRSERRKPELSTFIQDVLWKWLEDQEDEQRFTHVNTWEDKVRITDRQHPNTLIDVLIREGKLYCTFDKRANCEHVGFVWTLPQVRRALST
jgi:hypothetical protein